MMPTCSRAGATVTAYDPVAMHEAQRIFGDDPRLTYAENPMARWTTPMRWSSSPSGRNSAAPDFDAIKAR
jgi:UDPglucose 6-dehydrogenase